MLRTEQLTQAIRHELSKLESKLADIKRMNMPDYMIETQELCVAQVKALIESVENDYEQSDLVDELAEGTVRGQGIPERFIGMAAMNYADKHNI